MKEKILILCNGIGVVNRGAEKYSNDIYNLLKDDYDVTLLGAKHTKTKTRKELRVPWRNGKAYHEAYLFGKDIYKNFHLDYDLILNNSGFVGSYWCNKIRKKHGIPFVTFERGGGKEEKINNLFKPDMISYLSGVSYRKSKYPKKIHLPIGIKTKTHPLKIPVRIENLERPIILSPSAMVDFKRINLTIDAVKKLGKGTLVQTSDGKAKDFLNKYGKLHLGHRYFYAGKVDNIESYFQHCDIVVNASQHEAFGIIYLEAMKHNKPVVTENDEQRRDILGFAGYFANCEDVDDYKDKIDEALNTDLLKIPRKQALKYDWKTLKPKYIDMIEELI